MDLVALKAELATGVYSDNDSIAADQLNNINRPIFKDTVGSHEIASVIVKSEYLAANPNDREYLKFLLTPPSVKLTSTVRNELGSIFQAGSVSRPAIVALFRKQGSRAQELDLGYVTPSDIANARRL